MLSLREKGVFKISDVEMAVLETNGELSVMLKTEQQPITPKMLGIPVEQEHGPTILIMDGQLLKKGRSEEHTSELQSRGHLVCRLLLEKKKYDGKLSDYYIRTMADIYKMHHTFR